MNIDLVNIYLLQATQSYINTNQITTRKSTDYMQNENIRITDQGGITLYKPKEAAAKLRISEQSLKRLIWTRRIAATKVGSHWRLTEKALQDYIATQTQNVAQ